ncbi:MAG: Smr/MutS family protein [Burkholderiaceae bacterium]
MPLKDSTRLGELRSALRARAREIERERAEAATRRAEQERATNEFRQAIEQLGGVTPLPMRRRHWHHPPPPAPLTRPRTSGDEAIEPDALSDDIDVDRWLETDEALAYHRPGLGPDIVRKLRRGHWNVQAEIDLHGLRVDEARGALGAFLREALKHGERCVRIVHGKGLGSKDRQPVLKRKVLAWLVQRKEVIAFVQARPADGGSGALIVLLSGARPHRDCPL